MTFLRLWFRRWRELHQARSLCKVHGHDFYPGDTCLWCGYSRTCKHKRAFNLHGQTVVCADCGLAQ